MTKEEEQVLKKLAAKNSRSKEEDEQLKTLKGKRKCKQRVGKDQSLQIEFVTACHDEDTFTLIPPMQAANANAVDPEVTKRNEISLVHGMLQGIKEYKDSFEEFATSGALLRLSSALVRRKYGGNLGDESNPNDAMLEMLKGCFLWLINQAEDAIPEQDAFEKYDRVEIGYLSSNVVLGRQRTSREMKLINRLFEVVQLADGLLVRSNDVKKVNIKMTENMASVIRLCFRVISLCILGNRSNEEYFADQKAILMPKPQTQQLSARKEYQQYQQQQQQHAPDTGPELVRIYEEQQAPSDVDVAGERERMKGRAKAIQGSRASAAQGAETKEQAESEREYTGIEDQERQDSERPQEKGPSSQTKAFKGPPASVMSLAKDTSPAIDTSIFPSRIKQDSLRGPPILDRMPAGSPDSGSGALESGTSQLKKTSGVNAAKQPVKIREDSFTTRNLKSWAKKSSPERFAAGADGGYETTGYIAATLVWVGKFARGKKLDNPAAEMLTTLFNNNKELLRYYVSKDTLGQFKDLIRCNGPKKELIRFFQAICSVHGERIPTNQDLCLEYLYLNRSNRRQLLLETTEIKGHHPPVKFELNSEREYFAENPNSGKDEFRRILEQRHGKFLGIESWEQGFTPVYVAWFGADDWKPGGQSQDGSTDSPLFFSPAALKCDTVQKTVRRRSISVNEPPPLSLGQNQLVEREIESSWVLIEDLCADIGEKNQHRVDLRTVSHVPVVHEHRRQLALYYEATIDLFSEMCLDRSYNCIHILCQEFSYKLLMCCVVNKKLPDQIRASFTNLLLRLWVDRFPHERSPMPRVVWVWDSLVQSKEVAEDGALSQFALTDTHPAVQTPKAFFCEDEDASDTFTDSAVNRKTVEFFAYPLANKFHLVEELMETHFRQFGQQTVYTDRERNILSLNSLETLRCLVQFGFYGSYDEICRLVRALIFFMDGRTDMVEEGMAMQLASSLSSLDVAQGTILRNSFKIAKGAIQQPEGAIHNLEEKVPSSLGVTPQPLERASSQRLGQGPIRKSTGSLRGEKVARYEFSNEADLVFQSKERAAALLYCVAQNFKDYRTQRLLTKFKTKIRRGQKMEEELLRFAQDSFLGLFNTKETAIDLDLICEEHGCPKLNIVLLDLLLYKSPGIFESSLVLLREIFCKRACLLDALANVHLVESGALPVFGSIQEFKEQTSTLNTFVVSYQMWGVEDKISGFDLEAISILKKVLADIKEFCEPRAGIWNVKHQGLCRSFDVDKILMEFLKIDFQRFEHESPSSYEMLRKVVSWAISSLRATVGNNQPNQARLFEGAMATMIESMEYDQMLELIADMFEHNTQLCMESERVFELIDKLARYASTGRCMPDDLRVFEVLLVSNNQPIAANQKKIFAALPRSFWAQALDCSGSEDKSWNILGASVDPELNALSVAKLAAMLVHGTKTDNTDVVDSLQQMCQPQDIMKSAESTPSVALRTAYFDLLQVLHLNPEWVDSSLLLGYGWDLERFLQFASARVNEGYDEVSARDDGAPLPDSPKANGAAIVEKGKLSVEGRRQQLAVVRCLTSLFHDPRMWETLRDQSPAHVGALSRGMEQLSRTLRGGYGLYISLCL
jgi:hypothetical protein